MEFETKYIDENKWRVELEALTQEYERMLAFIEQELKTAPEGSLVIYHSARGPQYYIRKDRERQYLSRKEKEQIRRLAAKSYYIDLKKTLEKLVKRYRRILGQKTLPEPKEVYAEYHEQRKCLLEPLDSGLLEYLEQWQKRPYETKGFLQGDPEYYAKNGLRVRSKSEAIIVDLLIEYGIPFRYECGLYLKSIGEIHPDFIVLNKRTGEEFVWEHFGKVDDWKYANDMVKRIEAYHYNGYYEGKNLIYTLESSRQPFGARDAKRIIEQYLI